MADKKIIFVAFAIEDIRIRDLIKGQSLHTDSPFESVDMSVKEAYDEEWKKRVRTRILRSDGVLAIVSKNSLASTGQNGRFNARKKRRRPCEDFGRIRKTGQTWSVLTPLFRTWDNIAAFINSI